MVRRRFVEGVVFTGLLVVAMLLFGDPSRTLAVLAAVDPVPYLLALATTLLGVVVWSGTLSALLRVQDYQPAPGRFQVVFVAGMGVRGLIPGGSTSGPLVVGYVLQRTTDVSSETSIAMAYVLEVFLWLGSATVGVTGFVGYLSIRNLPVHLLQLATGLLAMMAIVFGTVLYAIYHPGPVEAYADSVTNTLYSLSEGHSEVLRRVLDPSAVQERFDRFFAAFHTLGDDVKHLAPSLTFSITGWFIHATTLYFVFDAVGVAVPYPVALLVVPVSGLVEGISIFPGGLGAVGPLLLTLILLLTPVTVAMATTVVVLYRLSNYWFRVGLGFLALTALGTEDVLRSSPIESSMNT